MLEVQARILKCDECGADVDKPCVSLTGKRKGKSRNTAHASRVAAVTKYIREAYCANESLSGYPCGVDGCPHCGGGNDASLRQSQTNQ